VSLKVEQCGQWKRKAKASSRFSDLISTCPASYLPKYLTKYPQLDQVGLEKVTSDLLPKVKLLDRGGGGDWQDSVSRAKSDIASL